MDIIREMFVDPCLRVVSRLKGTWVGEGRGEFLSGGLRSFGGDWDDEVLVCREGSCCCDL